MRIDSNTGIRSREASAAPRTVAPLPPSTWRMHTRHLMYPIAREPENATLYTRAGTVDTLSDRRQGTLIDEWA